MSLKTTWVGLAGGAGATVIGGIASHYVHFVNMGNTNARIHAGVSGLRLGAAAHIGGNASLAIMTGVSKRADVRGLKSSGLDFAVDLGAKWGDIIKGGGRAAQGLKMLQKVSDIPTLKLWAKSEAGKSFVNGLTGDLSLSHKKPSFAMFSIPFAGAGVGAGIWYEWQKVIALGGAQAWNFFKPRWRLHKHMGNLWLQIGNVPEVDGKSLIVNFREDVWGHDTSLEVKEPFLKGWSTVISGTVKDHFLYEDAKSGAPVKNAPPGGGLNLSWRTLAGRWTRNGVVACKANEKFGVGLDVATGGKGVWETDDYIKITTDKNGNFGNIINPGNKWKK